MKLLLEVLGSFQELAKEAEGEIGSRVRLATARHTERLKQRLRQQVLAAGMGRRLANTWQSKDYPARGVKTLSPAGYVYSKAPLIVGAYADGATITGKSGNWLAIPTGAVPFGAGGGSKGKKRKSPVEVEAHFNQELRVVRPQGSNGRYAFLVLDGLTRAKGRAGGRGRFKQRTVGRARQGRTAQTVVMFVLVPQVRLKKLFDLAGPLHKTATELHEELRSLR